MRTLTLTIEIMQAEKTAGVDACAFDRGAMVGVYLD